MAGRAPSVRRPSSPFKRMLVQSTLFIAPLVGGQTPSTRECPPASSNLCPQLQLLSLLSASCTFTNFSIEETPQAGPDTVFLILLGASRPQPREHPDSRSGWGWRSWPRSSLREGALGGSAGWVGGGGSPGPGAQTKGLPRAGPEAFSYRGTQEVWGQRDPKSYQVRSVSSRVSRQGAFGMHFALGHPRPLLPALWGHWDGTKPSTANQLPHWSLRSKP